MGTQLPFERLVLAMDEWAGLHPEKPVFIQLGETVFQPRHCEFTAFTEPTQWDALFQQAELVVSHAGMGTILKCLDQAKPLIVMPRLATLGEHRNDHQVATVQRFLDVEGIRIVENRDTLFQALDTPFPTYQADTLQNSKNLTRLTSEIRDFILANS